MAIYLPPRHNAARADAPEVSKGASCVGYTHLWVEGIWDGDTSTLRNSAAAVLNPGCIYLTIQKWKYDERPEINPGYTWGVCWDCYLHYRFQMVWQELRAMT